jgi:hypothetical protein
VLSRLMLHAILDGKDRWWTHQCLVLLSISRV